MSLNEKNRVVLDVDSSILEKNLFVMPEEENDPLNKLFPPSVMMPSKIVKPLPGFCVKTLIVPEGRKLFINVCQTDAIPAPKDINTTELVEVLASMDPENYKVPMSIGEPKNDKDSSGNPATVCDIAINPKFFKKISKEEMFRVFFLRIVFEALDDKHKITADAEKFVVLKNKKVYGELQVHRIQDRDVAKAKGLDNPDFKSVLPSPDVDKKPLIEVMDESHLQNARVRQPLYRILREPPTGVVENLVGEFKLDGVQSASEICLDIGEDRILLEARDFGFLLDVFVPHNIIQDKIEAQFNKVSSVLTVTMPVMTAARCI